MEIYEGTVLMIYFGFLLQPAWLPPLPSVDVTANLPGYIILSVKNNEKYTVGYSVLNPATNSDSDSTKSNGARVVSPSIHIR